VPATTLGETEALELSAPERLNDDHQIENFDCGEASINHYLIKMARKAQATRHAVVYVICLKGTRVVVGFYTLSNGSIIRAGVVPKSAQRNSPSQHPVTILGRMGLCRKVQGNGFAVDLLQDAVERCFTASQAVGSTAVLVHPLSDRLAQFYGRFGFIPCPDISPITMMLPLRW